MFLNRKLSSRNSTHQWWSLETWSRSRDDSHFCKSGFWSGRLQVSVTSLLSWDFEYCKNVAEDNCWNSTSFLSVVFAGKKQPKQVGKMPESRKNFNLEVVTTFFQKFRQNSQILKSRVSVSNFKSRRSVSEFLMKSRSRSINEVSVSTASLLRTLSPDPEILFSHTKASEISSEVEHVTMLYL